MRIDSRSERGHREHSGGNHGKSPSLIIVTNHTGIANRPHQPPSAVGSETGSSSVGKNIRFLPRPASTGAYDWPGNGETPQHGGDRLDPDPVADLMVSSQADASHADVWTAATAQAVVLVLVLCVLIAAGFYLMASFRDYTAKDRRDLESDVPNFAEMLARGDITEEEYRMIMAKSHGDSIAECPGRSPSGDRTERSSQGASREG